MYRFGIPIVEPQWLILKPTDRMKSPIRLFSTVLSVDWKMLWVGDLKSFYMFHGPIKLLLEQLLEKHQYTAPKP